MVFNFLHVFWCGCSWLTSPWPRPFNCLRPTPSPPAPPCGPITFSATGQFPHRLPQLARPRGNQAFFRLSRAAAWTRLPASPCPPASSSSQISTGLHICICLWINLTNEPALLLRTPPAYLSLLMPDGATVKILPSPLTTENHHYHRPNLPRIMLLCMRESVT